MPLAPARPSRAESLRRFAAGKHFNPLGSGVEKLERLYENGRNTSKHADKNKRRKKNRRKQNKEKIYSITTVKKYKQIWRRYCRFLQDRHIRVHNWPETQAHIRDYLDDLLHRGRSISYIKTVGCALNKLFYGSYLSDYDLPRRTRETITRSRSHSHAYYQEAVDKHPELVRFCLATGLRKIKELARVRGTDLVLRDGRFCLAVKGKGGQRRFDPLGGDRETQAWIVGLCHAVGDQKLFPKPPKDLDVHALRAVFACLYYQAIARPADRLPKAEQYRCRADYKGIVLDRSALRVVSEALGHHRESVIPQSYIWPFVLFDKETKQLFGLTLELHLKP